MGSQQSVNAAENDGITYWKNRIMGSGGDGPSDSDLPPVSSTKDATSDAINGIRKSFGAGDATDSKVTTAEAAKSAEDPRTIVSSLPSFPGSWNELHKVKGTF